MEYAPPFSLKDWSQSKRVVKNIYKRRCALKKIEVLLYDGKTLKYDILLFRDIFKLSCKKLEAYKCPGKTDTES